MSASETTLDFALPCHLSQVSALLELAEQIQKGEIPDPDGIFLAMGSSCTASGLVIGVALCRALRLPVFRYTTGRGGGGRKTGREGRWRGWDEWEV